MSLYKNINFNQFLKGVELAYAGPPRVPPSVVEAKAEEAYARGRQEATDELNEQILRNRREVQQLLGETMEVIDRKAGTCLQDVVSEIPSLVTSIARRVLAEVEVDGKTVKRIVDEVLADLPTNKDQIEIFLSPHDLELLNSYLEEPDREYPHCVFIEDASLGMADCRVESKFGSIDATVDTKLKHIEEQLGA